MKKTEFEKKLDSFRPLNSVLEYTIPKLAIHHPFKLLYYLLFKKIYYKRTLKGKIKKVETFFGQDLQILLPASLDIYFFGLKSHPSEVALAKYLIKNLGDGDTFIDIGAHFGYFTKLASCLVGNEGRVIAIEASPETYKILLTNINGSKNIVAKNIAMSNLSDSFIEFCVFPVYYSELNTLNPEQYQNTGWFHKVPNQLIRIPTTTVSDLIDEADAIPKIIKIDVEGAEQLVIEGTIQKFDQLKECSIIIEFNNDKKTDNYLNTEKILRSHNFQPFYINQKGELESIEEAVEDFMTERNIMADNIVFKKQ